MKIECWKTWYGKKADFWSCFILPTIEIYFKGKDLNNGIEITFYWLIWRLRIEL